MSFRNTLAFSLAGAGLILVNSGCSDAVSQDKGKAKEKGHAHAEAVPNLDLRMIERDQNLDLMDAHLTNGKSRSIPVVILLDDGFCERGWWGPRPTDRSRSIRRLLQGTISHPVHPAAVPASFLSLRMNAASSK